MKASLVAYEFRNLEEMHKLKIVKYGYIKGSLKWPATHIWLLKILGVNPNSDKYTIFITLALIKDGWARGRGYYTLFHTMIVSLMN
jgi:hypothetical protein